MIGSHRLVIVGTGMAGARLAEHVITRKDDRPIDIVMFGDEPGGTYNRILLPGVLSGTHAGPDIVTNPVEWYASNGITLHGQPAARIDLAMRQVIGAEGAEETFDTLVFATGSKPVVPQIEGLTRATGMLAPGAFVFRILGHGISVTVVHLAGHVMEAQLDRDGGRILQRQLERLGLEVLADRNTTRVHSDHRVRAIEFSDGSTVECDLLVIAAGVRPNVDLALDCGLRVGRGIIVDDELACDSAQGVYAIGDCAEHRGLVYGLVAPAWEQADVLADRITGRRGDATYSGTKMATKLKVAGLDVAVMGDRDPLEDDEVVSYAEPSRGIFSRVIVRGDRIAGAMLIGVPVAVPSVVQRFLDRAPVPDRLSDLLFPPTGDAPARAVDQIPDSTRICDCNAVVKEEIVEAVLNGARSLRAVCEKTRAGTGCGSCRPEVQRIVDFVCRDLEGGAPVAAVAGSHSSTTTGGNHGQA
jgi:nitrite reductase (NADH) large subunit